MPLSVACRIADALSIELTWLATGATSQSASHTAAPAQTTAPIRDRRLATLIAWIAETWEAASEFERGGWYARFVAAFPEARGGAGGAQTGGRDAGLARDRGGRGAS